MCFSLEDCIWWGSDRHRNSKKTTGGAERVVANTTGEPHHHHHHHHHHHTRIVILQDKEGPQGAHLYRRHAPPQRVCENIIRTLKLVASMRRMGSKGWCRRCTKDCQKPARRCSLTSSGGSLPLMTGGGDENVARPACNREVYPEARVYKTFVDVTPISNDRCSPQDWNSLCQALHHGLPKLHPRQPRLLALQPFVWRPAVVAHLRALHQPSRILYQPRPQRVLGVELRHPLLLNDAPERPHHSLDRLDSRSITPLLLEEYAGLFSMRVRWAARLARTFATSSATATSAGSLSVFNVTVPRQHGQPTIPGPGTSTISRICHRRAQ